MNLLLIEGGSAVFPRWTLAQFLVSSKSKANICQPPSYPRHRLINRWPGCQPFPSLRTRSVPEFVLPRGACAAEPEAQHRPTRARLVPPPFGARNIPTHLVAPTPAIKKLPRASPKLPRPSQPQHPTAPPCRACPGQYSGNIYGEPGA